MKISGDVLRQQERSFDSNSHQRTGVKKNAPLNTAFKLFWPSHLHIFLLIMLGGESSADVKVVNDRIASIKAEIEAINEQIKQANEKEKELQAEFDQQKKILAEEQKKSSERDAKQREIQAMRASIEEHKKSDKDIVTKFQNHLEVLKQEVKVADDDLARIIHENSEIEASITKLNDEQKQLRQALNDLQDDHVAAENAHPMTQEQKKSIVCGTGGNGFLF